MSLAKFLAKYAKGKGGKIGEEIGEAVATSKAVGGIAGDVAKKYPKATAAVAGGSLAGGVGLAELLGDDDDDKPTRKRQYSGHHCKACGK